MKKLFLAILALTSSTLYAQDLQLGDLNFFQKAKSTQVNTGVKLQTFDYSFEYGTDSFDYKRSINSWENEVQYGVSEKQIVGIAFEYDLNNQLQNTSVPSGQQKAKSYNDKGLSDLTLGTGYRLLSDKIYLDLIGQFTLGLEKSESGDSDANSSKDGNNKQGHHSLDLSIGIGQKIEKFEWRGTFGVVRNFAGEYDSLQVGAETIKVETDSSLDMLASGSFQFRPISKFAIGLNLSWQKSDKGTSHYVDSGDKIEQTVDSYSFITSDLVARYNFSENMLIDANYLFYNSDFHFGIKSKNTSSGATSTFKAKDYKSTGIRVGASFLF